MGGWFNDNGTAGSQGWCQFPSSHEEWEVPRNDLSHYTNWFIEDNGHGLVIEHIRSPFFGPENASKVAEVVRCIRNIHSQSFANWFPIILRFQFSKGLTVSINGIRNLQQEFSPVNLICVFPSFKSFCSHFYSPVYISLSRFCTSTNKCPISWVMGFKGNPIRCRHPFIIY